MGGVIATYMKYNRCEKKRYYIEENRGQSMILDRQRWCGCQKKREEEAVQPREAEA